MPFKIFQRRLSIVDFAAKHGRQTLEQIAKALGISITSVHRHQKAVERLPDDPVHNFFRVQRG